ncbi:Zn(II)2Cys6 transcription factor domain-containing protein Ecym_2522 [Eremothecium cymbalariae DBVPG|uniref:Zn(2)-C6 fungal-type domain-containing protein n=1 Tax=Eremothecium cymbalariae (strain CBS 270.75 / DBVPG 7215 / KCTC 17166 / NRRL Y-17582) TaxID=931890 RepID=G8JQ85_ERECY|nr:Hypothetical protein Ecym_2522 [Eremothecium cymbalariae DBVPG\
MAESDNKVVKTRRKVSKSCVFCRKRRVKCDKARPKCSTCVSKGLPECVYLSEFTHDVNSRELFSSTPNVKLLRRIDELETELARMKSEMIPMFLHQNFASTHVDSLNKLSDFHLVIEKHGRTVFYGPTSYRTVVAALCPRFYHYSSTIWTKLRKARCNWKKANNYTSMTDSDMMDIPLLGGNVGTILDALKHSLPSYEVIRKALEFAFKSPFYRNFSFLDGEKVMRDFYTCFSKGPKNSISGQSPIISLIPVEKNNYYPVGVIVLIFSIVNYGQYPPPELELFLKYLSNSFSGKVFYVERVEFFLLRFFYRDLFSKSAGDCIHTVFFAHEAATTAIHMGFHKDIKDLYKNHPTYKDKVVYLENLWHWVLFIDIDVSLATGVPLYIAQNTVSLESISNPNTGNMYFLKKVIVKLRSVLIEIHSPIRTPDLKVLIEDIREFVRQKYKPLNFYLHRQNLNGQEYLELESLMLFMSTMFHMSMVNLIINNDFSPENFATIFQYILYTIKLTMVIIQRYFELDSIYYPQRIENAHHNPMMHLQLGICIMAKMCTRAIVEYYTLLFDCTMCVDASSQRTNTNDPVSSVFDLNIETLEVQNDHYISITAAAGEIRNLFEKFLGNMGPKLLEILKRKYPFMVLTSLEKICNAVLESAIESRNTVLADIKTKESLIFNTDGAEQTFVPPLVYKTAQPHLQLQPQQRQPDLQYQQHSKPQHPKSVLKQHQLQHHHPHHYHPQQLQQSQDQEEQKPQKIAHQSQRSSQQLLQQHQTQSQHKPQQESPPPQQQHQHPDNQKQINEPISQHYQQQPIDYFPAEQPHNMKQFMGTPPYVHPVIKQESVGVPLTPFSVQQPSQHAQLNPPDITIPSSTHYPPYVYSMPIYDQQLMKSMVDQFWANFDTGIDDWLTNSGGSFNHLSNLFRLGDSPDERDKLC